MEWLINLFRRPPSADVAKDRLKLVLIHDRAECSADILEMMKNDIVQVIAKYMDIGDDFDLHIETGVNETGGPVPVLYANIPIKSMRKGHA